MSLLFVVASFAAAYLLSSVLNQLALFFWQRGRGDHWTERARRLYPVRVATMINPLLFAAAAAITIQLLRGEATILWLPSTLAAWLGAVAAGYVIDHLIWPGLSFKKWASQFVLYWMFFRAGLFLTAIAFFMMPPRLGWQTWVIIGTLVMLIISLAAGFTTKILSWTRLIQLAPAHVNNIAARAAARAGAKLRKVWINQGTLANAFALLPMNDMLFSDRLLQIMSDEELESVCAHEAAHLTESKWVFCGRLLGTLALCPLTLFVPVAHEFGLRGVLLLLAATIALVVLPRGLARRMEQRADAAAAHQAIAPAVYARALEKLYEANLIPAVMPKRSRLPHPDLYDRMLAASVTPSYERPRSPGRMSWTTYLLSCVLGFLIVTLASTRQSPEVAVETPELNGESADVSENRQRP